MSCISYMRSGYTDIEVKPADPIGGRAAKRKTRIPSKSPGRKAVPNSATAVVLAINDNIVKLSAELVLKSAGYRPLSWDQDNGEGYLLTDDLGLIGPRTILIVDETLGAANHAIKSLTRSEVRGVVCRSRPEQISTAISAAEAGMICVPSEVLIAARDAPDLNSRQLRILKLVASGLPNLTIAKRLSVSEATIKREMSELLRLFECSSRVELVIRATSSGYGITAKRQEGKEESY